MRLTIIPIDGFVAVDSVSKFSPLDLTSCEIPADIHALQWYDNKGWIEFNDDNDPFTPKPQNEMITQLPSWANACVNVWTAWTPPVIQEQPAVTE